jgi:tetratricopeptide (TPR) repeat protein
MNGIEREIPMSKEAIDMSSIKRTFLFSACFFITVALLGCATTSTPQPKKAYHPKLPPGVTTLEAAIEDLATLLKTPIIYIEYGETDYKVHAQDEEAKARLKERISYLSYESVIIDDEKVSIKARSIPVYRDRIDIPIYPLFYEDLLESNIVVDHDAIKLPSRVKLNFWRYEQAANVERIADDLLFIQQALKKKQDERLALFESKAAQYRALKANPTISEEQRKLIVQANAASQQKDYTGAIDLYKKAIEQDPFSYPGAYFNVALLCAQLQKYNQAITYMRQYLMLEPEAKDARSARDKIYEWEFMAKKKK